MSQSSGWSLVARGGALNGRVYPLSEQGVQLGRAEDCEVVLPSQNVSRKHARVFVFQGTAFVQDLGSRNGVFVNGVRVQQQGLQAGDTVTMGEFAFQVMAGSAPAGGSKRGLLYGTLVLVLVGLGVAGVAIKGGGGGAPVEPAPLPQAQPSEVKSMFDKINQPGRTIKPAGGTSASPASAGQGGQGAAAIPDAQRNQMVREYLERGMLLQDAGKLTEARDQYERALKLDPNCALCLTRYERTRKEIAARIQRQLDDGMRAFKGLRYEEAISSWELVLNLSPDPGSQAYQQATRYIADAKAKLETQQKF